MMRLALFALFGSLVVSCDTGEQSAHGEPESDHGGGESENFPGELHVFKPWPTGDRSFQIHLIDAVEKRQTQGPDFTVQYFTFSSGSLAIYNGGHPNWGSGAETPTKYKAKFGSGLATWTIEARDDDVKAHVIVPDGTDNYWHVIVIAPSIPAAKAIIEQTKSFRPTKANKAWDSMPSSAYCFPQESRVSAGFLAATSPL